MTEEPDLLASADDQIDTGGAEATPSKPRRARFAVARSRVTATPLRVRMVAVSVVLVTVGLVAAGTIATTSLRGYLYDRVDQQLAGVVNSISRRVPCNSGFSQPGTGGPGLQGNPPSQFYIRCADSTGAQYGTPTDQFPGSGSDENVARPKLPTMKLADVQKRLNGSSKFVGPFTVGSASGDSHWRVIETTATFTTQDPLTGLVTSSTNGTVAIAARLDDVEHTTERLVRLELIVGLIVVVAMGGVSYGMVRRSLRPLLQVEHTAEAIVAGDMSLRVPEHDPRTEVGSLSRSFNTMLTRIESAFREREESEEAARTSEGRMRRFVADASHELRTPLTSIRGFAELHRQGAIRDEEGVERAMTRIEGEATRMGVLVDDLLLLARLDQQRPLDEKPVDLAELVSDAVHSAQVAGPEHPISFNMEAEQEPIVTGDALRLRQVVSNLLSNAIAHTPAKTRIEVSLSTDDGRAVIEVRDHGPGLSEEDAAKVFERFYRADSSRTKATGGSGLGLSIVSSIVGSHHGRVELDTAPGEGATFRVILPLA